MNVRAVGEFKERGSGGDAEARKELGEYARMIFLHQPNRRFVICFQLINKFLRLLIYDRSGTMISARYNVHAQPEVLLGIVYGLAVADPGTLGYDTTMVLDSSLSSMAHVRYQKDDSC